MKNRREKREEKEREIEIIYPLSLFDEVSAQNKKVGA